MAGNMEANVKINVVANTQQFDSQMQSSMINAAKHGAITDNGLASVPGEKANGNLSTLNETFTTLNDVMNQVLANFKVFNDRLKGANGNGNGGGNGFGNDDVSGDNNIFKKMGGLKGAISGVVGAAGTGVAIYQGYNAYQRQMMHGNWLDAKVTGIDTTSNALSSIGGSMTMLGLSTGLAPLALIGGLLSLGGVVGKGISSYQQKENDEYRMFADNYTTFDQLQVGYDTRNKGKRNSSGWKENTSSGFELYKNYIANNKELGLEDTEYMSLLSSMSRYTSNGFIGNSAVVDSAKLARVTNGNASSIADTMGYLLRYSGNANILQTAYSNSSKMGFSDTQFDELMSGIRSSMEKGVSKGFATNITAIMETAASFSNASGSNTFWSGEQAIKRVETFRDAMSNSKNLDSVNDVAMYKAVAGLGIDLKSELGDSYTGNKILDTRAYLERGNITPAFLNKVMDNLKGYYGNDSTALVTSLEQMGFSSNEAAQFYNMWKNGGISSVGLNNAQLDAFTSATTQEIDVKNALTRETTVKGNLEEQLGKIIDTKTFKVSMNNKIGEYRENVSGDFISLASLKSDSDDKWLYNVMNKAAYSDNVDDTTYGRMLQAIANNQTGWSKEGLYSYDSGLKTILQGILDSINAGITVES